MSWFCFFCVYELAHVRRLCLNSSLRLMIACCLPHPFISSLLPYLIPRAPFTRLSHVCGAVFFSHPLWVLVFFRSVSLTVFLLALGCCWILGFCLALSVGPVSLFWPLPVKLEDWLYPLCFVVCVLAHSPKCSSVGVGPCGKIYCTSRHITFPEIEILIQILPSAVFCIEKTKTKKSIENEMVTAMQLCISTVFIFCN